MEKLTSGYHRERTSKLMADERFAVVIDVLWSVGDEHRYKLCKKDDVYYVIPYVKFSGMRKFRKFPRESWVRVDESLVDDIHANPQLVAIRRNVVPRTDSNDRSSEKKAFIHNPAHA